KVYVPQTMKKYTFFTKLPLFQWPQRWLSSYVTSNLEFGQWNRIFGDNRLTSALVDCLVHHAHIIAFTGESYHLRNALSSGNTKINI
ncbi:ATP-binding protein, partial [Bacillus cereus]|uniref:ATP-binding protein n=1 Tax=Bacillus cereus TaxID=1396 RepID=UPI0020D28866